MKWLGTIGLAALALSACGLTPSEYCHDVSRITCEKTFACATGPTLDALNSMYGDVKGCISQYDSRLQCSTQTERTYCVSLKWNAKKAQACLDEVNGIACEQASSFRPMCSPPCE